MKKEAVLNDKDLEPNEEIVFAIIGEHQEVWKQTMAYLYDHHKDISEVWRFYKDGNAWLFRTLKKKNTIFWVNILEDTFSIGFWFGDKLEEKILESELPNHMKEEFLTAKKFNKIRNINIDVSNPKDIVNIKILIDIKLNK